MIKLKALENFTLERFNEIQDIERAGKEQKNWINKNDTFKCGKDLADYLLGDNPLKRPVVKVIEIEPEVKVLSQSPVEELEKAVNVKAEITTANYSKSKKKKTSKK